VTHATVVKIQTAALAAGSCCNPDGIVMTVVQNCCHSVSDLEYACACGWIEKSSDGGTHLYICAVSDFSASSPASRRSASSASGALLDDEVSLAKCQVKRGLESIS
jgi:hypothetical protein